MDRPPRLPAAIRRLEGCARYRAPAATVRLSTGLPDARRGARCPDSEGQIHQAEIRSSRRVSRVRPQRELENQAVARGALGGAPRESGSGGIRGAAALGKGGGAGASAAPRNSLRGPRSAQARSFRERLRDREGPGLRLHGYGIEPPRGGARRAFGHPLWVDRLRAHRRIGRLAGAPKIRSSLFSLPRKNLPLHLGRQSLPRANRPGKGFRRAAASHPTRTRAQASPSLTGIRFGPKALLKSSKRPAIAPPHCLHLPSSVTR